MYYGKKKGIIIAISVTIVVVVLAIVGIILVTKTDLFKSNKTLFWKYLSSVSGENEKITSAQLQDIEKMKDQKPYTIKGELTASSDDPDLDEVLNLLKLEVDGQADKSNEYAHTNAVLEMGNEALIDLDYTNTNNIYALKSDDIVTVYLGIRNENLKVMAQKLGLQDVSMIPDKLSDESANYLDLFNITDAQLEYLSTTYGDLIMDNIPDDHYSKQTDATIEKNGTSYTTTSYRLDLSGEEVKQLLLMVLGTAKTDDTTLNLISSKALTLGMTEEKASRENIVHYIDDMMTIANDKEFDDVSFVVYNYKGKNIATEIIVKNQQKVTVYKELGRISFKLEDLTGNGSYEKLQLDINYTLTSTQTSLTFKLTIDDKEIFTMTMDNTGSAAQGSLNTEITLSTNYNQSNVELTYTQTLTFVEALSNVVQLDNTNCAVLNDFTKEQIAGLIQAISERINVVSAEKGQILSNVFANQAALQRAQQNTTNNDLDNNNNNDLTPTSASANEIQSTKTNTTLQPITTE